MIHFLTNPTTNLAGVDGWDPDEAPERFADGEGHNLIEMYRRLRDTGRMATIGPRVPRDCTLVVMMALRLQSVRPVVRVARTWPLRRHRVVLIRSDLPVSSVRRFRVDVEVAPSPAFLELVGREGRCFLQALPQRGLLARDPDRGDRITAACLKANPHNVPADVLEPGFRERLEAIGVRFDVDAPALCDGEDQRWHDFSAVDAAICVRPPGIDTRPKPATKLVNAWAAGVIPLASREPGYEALGTHRRNVIFFDGIDELPDLVLELQTDDALRHQLWEGVAAAAAGQPSVEQLVDRWWDLLVRYEARPSLRRALQSAVFMVRHENLRELVVDLARAVSSVSRRRARALGQYAPRRPRCRQD